MNTSGRLIMGGGVLSELSSLANFDQSFFPHPWTLNQWHELNLKHHFVYSWHHPDLVGFALLHRVSDDETAHLLKICLHPILQGKGESMKFWEEILKDLRSKSVKFIFLEVETTNQRAIGFYQKMGFQNLRQVRGFYSTGGDALTMQLTL
jgi:[ribosomal protein S18]-alanine N-acetyltransferase